MRLRILAVGRARDGPEAALVAQYRERAAQIGRRLGIAEVLIEEREVSRLPEPAARRKAEGDALRAALPAGCPFLALDERGEDLASDDLAGLIRRHLEQGDDLAFLIGGPDGHDEALRQAARRTIRFGRATWPHLLVRAMLAEQVYRALTILSGHPYHRA